ncbi:MAG: sulfur carrier protein ThiS adenylyltransferase ThiF [Kiritimatiellae bacterium]|nr:sulfur carrier protein ThiS adenylyltransferase ThiF [Kiritimatiellia bacterium]
MSANTYLTPEERAALESVRVGIAGAGGLGSNCAMHLVRSGVKHITIADFDVVNESNLNRQFFFRDQIGQKKVEAVKENLLRIEPDADIRAVDMRLDASSAREIFADCGIVVEAFDAVDAKVMLVSAFASSGKKLVTASGLAGWGRSNAMRVRKMGNIVAIGDGETSVGDGAAPVSPRVGIAAAMEANAVVSLLLGCEP